MPNDVTLTSTTDSLEQVQDALGIPTAERATEAPAPTPDTPPVLPGVVSATTTPAPKGKAAAPAAEAPTVEEKVETPEPTASDEDDEDDTDEGEEVDPAAKAAAAELGRKGGQKRGVLAKRLHKTLEVNSALRTENAATKAELAELRRRLDEMAAGGGKAASPAAEPGHSAAPPAAASEAPKPTDYPTYEAWVSANARWEAEQVAAKAVEAALKAERERVARENAKVEESAAVQKYKAQEVDARVKYEDYDEVLANPELPQEITPLMKDLLLNSEVGAEMAYHLGKNPEICHKIVAMGNSAAAAKAIGRIEAAVEKDLAAAAEAAEAAKAAKKPAAKSLATVAAAPAAPATPAPAPVAKAPAKPPVTKAPDPIEPVGTGTVATEKSPDQMTFNEYKAWRAAGGGRR